MHAKLTASVKTLWKYLLWTTVAAIATGLLERIGDLDIPTIWVPILAAILKSMATWAATQADG